MSLVCSKRACHLNCGKQAAHFASYWWRPERGGTNCSVNSHRRSLLTGRASSLPDSAPFCHTRIQLSSNSGFSSLALCLDPYNNWMEVQILGLVHSWDPTASLTKVQKWILGRERRGRIGKYNVYNWVIQWEPRLLKSNLPPPVCDYRTNWKGSSEENPNYGLL